MRKLFRHISIFIMISLITTIFGLSLISPSEASNTDSIIFNEEWLQQALFSNSTDIASLQATHIPTSQTQTNLPPLPCHGPHIMASIDKKVIEINQTVTLTGRLYPPEPNATVRVCYIRPDYSWIDDYVTVDPQTGEFTSTQILDMGGYWNIFPSHGHMTDRLNAEVIDPTGAIGDPTNFVNPFKPNIAVAITAGLLISIGIIVALTGLKKKTRRISSLRICLQVFIIFLLFFGMFVDHQNFPRPVRQIAVHEFLIGRDAFGGIMPNGLPAPFLACYFPCGRTVTCALWELQTYIYPFLEVGRGWGVDYINSGITRLSIVIGVIILSSVILGKFWCGWVCPFGLYQDVLTYFRRRLKIKRVDLPGRSSKLVHQLSYVILAAIIIISTIFASYSIIGTQLIPGTERGGFINNYYPAPWCAVCPMKPMCMLMQVEAGVMQPAWTFTGTGTFYHLGWFFTSVNLIILGIVTVAAFFIRRFWCRICPLGGLLALFNRFPPFKWVSAVRIEKSEEKCTKCGICKRVCPTQVTEVYEQKGGDVLTSECIGCLHCIEMCPYDDVLKFKFAGKTVCRSQSQLGKSKPSTNKADKEEGSI